MKKKSNIKDAEKPHIIMTWFERKGNHFTNSFMKEWCKDLSKIMPRDSVVIVKVIKGEQQIKVCKFIVK